MKLLIPAILLIITSCAHIHPGDLGQELNDKYKDELLVSAEIISDFSDPTMSFVSITLENKSDKWIRIKNAEFNCGVDCNDKVNVIVGDDLITWAKVKNEQIAMNDENASIVRSGISAAGLVVAILGTNSGTVATGAAVATVGLGAESISELSKNKTQLETAKWVPEKHIYSPTIIPSSLFTRKWLLISHPKNYKIKAFSLKMTTIDDENLTYILKIKRSDAYK